MSAALGHPTSQCADQGGRGILYLQHCGKKVPYASTKLLARGSDAVLSRYYYFALSSYYYQRLQDHGSKVYTFG